MAEIGVNGLNVLNGLSRPLLDRRMSGIAGRNQQGYGLSVFHGIDGIGGIVHLTRLD